ncbi:unnamed protein product [Ranitomeya imitator]|uniref:Uncharacterized protein n=1 Tax=Ranitomeya imitator TaxID=111125 RepID=A0ABN9L7G5_9NEOB|nr:unnamed protein product [Ranitomeya imitator]
MIAHEKGSDLLEWDGSENEVELHARPIVVTKTRREVTQRRGDRMDAGDAAVGTQVTMTEETRHYTAGELTELATRYRQQAGENLLTWIFRLWDNGANTIFLNYQEGIGIVSICIDPMVRLKMRRARDSAENFSLLHLVRDSVAQVYDSTIELIPQTRWESLADRVQRLKEIACIGGITRNPLPDMSDHFAVVEDWKGPDAAVMTVMMKNKFIEGAPAADKSPLFTMFNELMGNSTNVYTACSLISQLSALEKSKVSRNCTVDRVDQERRKGDNARVRKSRKELFCDQIASEVPFQEIDGISTCDLFRRWQDLKRKGTLKIARHRRVGTNEIGGWKDRGGTPDDKAHTVPTPFNPPITCPYSVMD